MKKKIIILMFMFMLSINMKVLANETPLEIISFDSVTTQFVMGYQEGLEALRWEIGIAYDYTNNNIEFYDKDNNLIGQGYQGTIPVNETLFPITIKCADTSPNHRIDVKLFSTTIIPPDATNQDIIESLGAKLEALKNKLSEIDDYLSNPSRLTAGINEVKASLDNLNNYSPLNTGGTTSTAISGISLNDNAGVSSELPQINVTFAEGITKNIFDLSQWWGIISKIRLLLTAILYISLFLYLMQVLIPRLKI